MTTVFKNGERMVMVTDSVNPRVVQLGDDEFIFCVAHGEKPGHFIGGYVYSEARNCSSAFGKHIGDFVTEAGAVRIRRACSHENSGWKAFYKKEG